MNNEDHIAQTAAITEQPIEGEERSKVEEPKPGVVTFLDVLGWKGIWSRKPSAIADLQELISKVKQAVRSDRLGIQFIDRWPIMQGREVELIHALTRVVSISDTLVLLTDCSEATEEDKLDASTAATWFHGEVCKAIICESIDLGVPIRGATAFGVFSDQESTFVGSAIDEAAAWHELVNWIGVIQAPSSCLGWTDPATDTWTPWEHIPFSSNGLAGVRCLDWRRHWLSRNGNDYEISLQQLKRAFMASGTLMPGVAEKYFNTLKFYECKGWQDETTG